MVTIYLFIIVIIIIVIIYLFVLLGLSYFPYIRSSAAKKKI